ncbi:MAG: MFS transporter [Planctomycetota bacterium]
MPALPLIGKFLPSSVPLMARPSYRRELTAALTSSITIAMLEPGVVAVLAKLVFNVSDLAFATIIASQMFANLTSLFWTRLAKGRRKGPVMSAIVAATCVLVATIAVLPTSGWGPTLLVAAIVVGRCFVAGLLTVRSIVWRANYRRAQRARITGRLVLLASVLFAVSPLGVYAMLDWRVDVFRVMYPLAAVVGFVGAASLWGLRVRREKHLLDHDRGVASSREPALLSRSGRPHNARTILLEDRDFRHYMIWQFIAGCANMMGEAAITLAIIDLAREAGTAEFTASVLLNTTITTVMVVLTIPLWAKLIDRVHIFEFRAVHGALWIVAQLGNYLAVVYGGLWWIAIPRAIQGVMFGGGRLAWQIGHNDFADRRLAGHYMGIHQTLTGVRGFVAPFIGVGLLTGFGTVEAGGSAWSVLGLTGFSGIGDSVFLVTTALALAAWLGFCAEALRVRRERRAAG